MKTKIPKGWRRLRRGVVLRKGDIRVYGPSKHDRFLTHSPGAKIGDAEAGTACPDGEYYIRKVAKRRAVK